MSFPRPLIFTLLPAAVLMLRALPASANCETMPTMAGCPGAVVPAPVTAHADHNLGAARTVPNPNLGGVGDVPVPALTGELKRNADDPLSPEMIVKVLARIEERGDYPDHIVDLTRRVLEGSLEAEGGFEVPKVGHAFAFAHRFLGKRTETEEFYNTVIKPIEKAGQTVPPGLQAKLNGYRTELRNMMNPPADKSQDPGASRFGRFANFGNTEIHNEVMRHDKLFMEQLAVMSPKDFVTAEPKNPSAHTNIGEDYLRQGRYQDAAAAASKAIELGGTADSYALRAAANSQLGKYPDAVSDARKSLDFNPNNVQAQAALRLSEGRGHGAAAGAAAGSYTPQTAASAASAAYGRGFMGGGSASSGRSHQFSAASRGSGAQAAGRFNDQARSAFSLGDARATLDFAARALAADPDNARAYYLRAMAYRSMGDWKAALAAAAKGLELAPKDAGLLAVYGNALNRTKDYKGALAAANRALEANPLDAWAFANRAYALGALGDREGMLESLRRAVALDPAFQKSLDQALQAPTDADLLFLFPGEMATDKKGAMGTAGRKKSFGLLAGAAALGGLFLALGLLSTVLAPLTDKVSSVFTRMTRRSPSVTASPEAAGVAAIGLLRGQFELGKQIGAGGMGLVYEGTDRSLNRRVAVKRMRDEIRLDPRERARFVSEAKTVAGLHHPNIVDIYAIVEEADDLHLVFEYVEGRTVHELISAKGRFTPAETARVVRGAADALDYAHGRGVIHRDMKPSNLMIDGSGRVKVMDFGIARVAKDAMTRVSMTNTVVGTPPYMAPEQEQGQVRKESDVYSLAICAYELLCGRLPFPGVGAGMLMNKINLSYVPPSKMIEGLPAGLDDVFAKAFQPDPDKRFHSSGEFASALQTALASPVRA